MPEVYANNASTVVVSGGATAPSSGTVESWTVASPGAFPALSAGQTFHVADPASAATATEKIKVTATSGSTWTVTRGDEGTTPVVHAAGFTVVQVVTAGGYAGFLQGQLDTTAGDIQPSPGTRAAGAAGLPADSGHVHGQPAFFAPTGLTGATAAGRYVGATASGAPVSGTFLLGDWVTDQSGKVWICTTAGTPGTWTPAGATLPLTTLGDTLYENATPAPARLAGNASATKNFLTQTGTGSVSAAPAWGTIQAGDVPTLNQSTTGTAAGLSATLPVGEGGTGQVTQQAAMDALAGAQTSGDFLRGNGTHVQMSAIQAADVPQLSQYNPVGLTGATTPTSYAGGTIFGHPLSGTWSQGQWVVDGGGKIYVCVAGGTPGTWRRVGAMPYQYFLDDYCKGDGQQALVTVTNANATINTTPLSAPSAPSLANAGSGGTILAGVYQVKVTYVNRWGETVASSSASTTTSGSASTITITAPALSGNATGWYAYVTQAGGSTYYRQQASGSPAAMGVSVALTAPPTTSGANPPGADSSAAAVFASGDIGKNIMICGALGSPGHPWIDTIATYVSPTSVILSTTGATASAAGCPMVFSSDDRLNVDQCISDARAYAVASQNFCQVIGSDRIYGLGTGLFQSTANTAGSNPAGIAYNTQVRIPVGNPSGETEKLEFQLLGPGDNSHNEFWVSQYVNLCGCSFVSYSLGPGSADATYGQQSVIGGPLGGMNFGLTIGFANTKAVIKGVQVVQPGFSNSIGIDLQWMGGFRLRASSQVFAPTTNTGGGVNPSNAWVTNGFWQGLIGTGLRTPNSGNNDDCVIESFSTEGLTFSVYSETDHLIIQRLTTLNTNVGIRLNPGSNAHNLTIAQWSFENVSGVALQNQGGGGSPVAVGIVMDGENADGSIGDDVQDSSNGLHGVIRWNDVFRTTAKAPTVSGAANVQIINDMLGPGAWSGAPAVPATTVAQQNTAWRDATVYLTSGGAAVTVIAVDGHTTGLTLGSSGAVAVRVPSGKNITPTYASTAPTWVWVLD